MIEERIQKIEERIHRAEKLSPETRAELMALLAALRAEVASLPEETAQRVATLAETSAEEATRDEHNPDLFRNAVDGLTSSVELFEVSHPRLAGTLSRMGMILSNMGI